MPSAINKVYFCGSMRGGRQDELLYQKLLKMISAMGKEILTEFVGWSEEKLKEQHKIRGVADDQAIHNDDVAKLREADAIVAEVTLPSLGVGYEIGRAVAMGKPILCLYRPQEGKELSAMIRGSENGGSFLVKDYAEEDAEVILKEFLL